MIVSKFDDRIEVGAALFQALGAKPGDRIWLGADVLHLTELSSDYSYVLAAKTLRAAPGASFSFLPTPENPIVSVEIFAETVAGALALSCDGADGRDGVSGSPGGDGAIGGDGGRAFVRYARASGPVTGSARPGKGGVGGRGTDGATNDGQDGLEGRPGVVDIAEIEAAAIWAELPTEFLERWRAAMPNLPLCGGGQKLRETNKAGKVTFAVENDA